jgi:hypothetical protein
LGTKSSNCWIFCEECSTNYRSGKKFADRPNSQVHEGVIKTLSEFAKITRYYNLAFVGGQSCGQAEPINAWWERVGQPILEKHYSKKQKDRDQKWASAAAEIIGDNVSVIHHAESGELIDNIEKLALRGSATKIVQKYGRLYTLQIIRWLAYLLSDIADVAVYQNKVTPLFGIGEPFIIFRAEDDILRSRRRWSIYQ